MMPLDYAVENAAGVMDGAAKNGVLETYKAIIDRAPVKTGVEVIDRIAFYERAKKAACIVVTCDNTRCANIILRKGVILKGQ